MNLLELVAIRKDFVDQLELVVKKNSTIASERCLLPQIDGRYSAKVL